MIPAQLDLNLVEMENLENLFTGLIEAATAPSRHISKQILRKDLIKLKSALFNRYWDQSN